MNIRHYFILFLFFFTTTGFLNLKPKIILVFDKKSAEVDLPQYTISFNSITLESDKIVNSYIGKYYSNIILTANLLFHSNLTKLFAKHLLL